MMARIAKDLGKPPEEITVEDMAPYIEDVVNNIGKASAWGGLGSVLDRVGKFVSHLVFQDPVQGLLVGSAVISGIVGIATALAGKGSMSAVSLLAALGLGVGAYMKGPEAFKGLVGLGKPGDMSGATEAAESAGAQTPEQLDEVAQAQHMLPKNMPTPAQPAGKAPPVSPQGKSFGPQMVP
jgi:hypothetical protein